MKAGPPTVPGLSGLTVLARGGYATVYRAIQESVGRAVAIKVENLTLRSEADRQRFLREAGAAARMSSHSHVVDLFDVGTTGDGHPYLIMELCAGSYADLLRERTMAPAEVCDVGAKIADALAGAHRVGVLHRDVKPANILITEFGEPTLADFGLAVLVASREPVTDTAVFTPAYAPQEAFQPGSRSSPAGDVYGLCATLYALLSGRPPRWPSSGSPTTLEILELFEQPVLQLPDVPAELLNLLHAGLANDPAARPTARQVSGLLAALAARLRQPIPQQPTAAQAGPTHTSPAHGRRVIGQPGSGNGAKSDP